MAQCTKVKPNGERCSAWAMQGSTRCFWHQETETGKKARQQASAKGGRLRRQPATLDDEVLSGIRFDSAADISSFCAWVAGLVLGRKVDAKAGNCAVLAASTALRSLDTHEVEERLKALEEQLAAGMKVA